MKKYEILLPSVRSKEGTRVDWLFRERDNNYNYNSRVGTPKNIKFNNNEILDASHSVAAGLIQNEINRNH